ncbi:hypothetical protein ACJW30_09G026100 [Castanea mollissima]
MCSIIAAASIWPGWCFNLCVKWSVNSGFPCITSAKIADKISDRRVRRLALKRTIEAKPEPTVVLFTRATPSFGCNSKNPELIPASWKA